MRKPALDPKDPETRAKLAEWRTHLAGPVEFRPFGWVAV